jgi:signal transduction histidine kinase
MRIDEQEASQSKLEFMDFVAHELKQPMTSIQGYARMLMMQLGGELNETQQQFVGVINANVERMGKLIDDLLDISRLEAGRIKLRQAPVPVRQIVDESLAGSREDIEARCHTVEVEIPEDLPPALGDRERLIQVLANLLSNAIQYTLDGGTIQIRADRTDPTEQQPALVRVTVSDTGIGMSPPEMAKLKEKFLRADHDLVRAHPGTGLGIPIARGLIALHGGELFVESEVDKGTTACFTLPIATDTEGV